MIPQTALVIPLFLLLGEIGLLNTPWAVILPSLVFPIGVFLMRAYIEEGVSNEIIDAGRSTGRASSTSSAFLAFRLMMPAFTTVLVLAFVANWNNYFLPLVVLNSSECLPGDRRASRSGTPPRRPAAAARCSSPSSPPGALVSIVPVIVAFLFVQRFWQGGLSTGAVK